MSDSLKILVIEDDLDQAALVKRCLTKFSTKFDVETLQSGKSGVVRLTESSYEAVILDYQLADSNGLEVLSEMSDNGCDTPVVVVSGHGSEQIAVESLKKGATDYLVKDESFLTILPKVVQQAIDKHHLEQKLRDSENKYQNIFENAGDAIIIIAPETYIISEANVKSAEIFGCEVNKLINKKFPELFPVFLQDTVIGVLRRAYSAGTFDSNNLVTISSNGKTVPLELNVKLIDLGSTQILCNVRNIAEKQHLQSLILNSKQRLQSTFDGITDTICQVNQNLEIVIANKTFAQLANLEPGEIIGRPYHEVLCKRDNPCEDCPATRTLKTLKPASVEKNMSGLIYEIWSYPIFNLDNKLESVAIYSKNITEKKKLEKTLVQSEKLASIGLLASGIAHELRNPLNVIETARYYIDEFLIEKNSDISAKLNIISKNVRRSSNIINELLEFSRQSIHAHELIDVNDLTESTISLIRKELEAKNIELTLNGCEKAVVYFSLDSLKQVMLNLIINAIQAMDSGGKLTITIEKNLPGWIDIKIADTGSGIPKENLQQIFSPFFTTKDAGEGTGLGLYITHMVVERDGGKIRVESTVNVGSVFTVSLPESEKMIAPKPKEPEPNREPKDENAF